MNRRKRPPDGGSALPPRTKRYEASRAFGENIEPWGRYRDDIRAACSNPDTIGDLVARVLLDGDLFDYIGCLSLPGVPVEALVKAALDETPLSKRNTASIIMSLSRILSFNEATANMLTDAMLDVEGEWRNDPRTDATMDYMLNTFKITPNIFGIGFQPERFAKVLAHDPALTMNDLLVLDSECNGQVSGFTAALAKHITHRPVDELRGFLLNRGGSFIGTEVRPLLEKLIAEGGWRDVILAAELYGLITNRSPAIELSRRDDLPIDAWVDYIGVLVKMRPLTVLSDAVSREWSVVRHCVAQAGGLGAVVNALAFCNSLSEDEKHTARDMLFA
jgi:hypothetical protein